MSELEKEFCRCDTECPVHLPLIDILSDEDRETFIQYRIEYLKEGNA